MNQRYVTSLEMSKELQKIGFKQDTEFYWIDMAWDKREGYKSNFRLINKEIARVRRLNSNGKDEQYASPLISELLEQLTNKDILDYCNRNEAMTMGEYINTFRSPDRCGEMWLEVKSEKNKMG